jgi:hypothetical protein
MVPIRSLSTGLQNGSSKVTQSRNQSAVGSLTAAVIYNQLRAVPMIQNASS